MRLTFQSNRLDSLFEQVRAQHPRRKGDQILISRSLLDEVRERLELCPVDKLTELAYAFDLNRLLACIHIIIHDQKKKLGMKAARILKTRPKEQVIFQGWFMLVRHYPCDLLEEVLRELIFQKGMTTLEKSSRVSDRIAFWLVSNRLSEGILRDVETAKANTLYDDFLLQNRLKPEDGLFQVAWRTMLAKGRAGTLQKESSRRILEEYARVTNVPYQSAFGRHYLNALKARNNWDEGILAYIWKTFGEPHSSDDETAVDFSFWRDVNPESRQEFLSWVILQRIEDFFEGERADFWRQYVDQARVKRVREILDKDGFMLDFGTFGVVEFKNVGNAAYVYPRNEFQKFWAGERFLTQQAGYFKDKSLTLRDKAYPGWDGRILHYRGVWQEKERDRIDYFVRTL